MMTTNKLTKILSGVATLGIATAIAAPAQAANFTVPLDATGQGMVDTELVDTGSGYGLSIGGMVYHSVTLGDKVFSDFSVVADVAAGDDLSFILNGGVWTVQYNPAGMGRDQGQLHYQVAITDPTMYFDAVSFDTDISGMGGTYKATKEIQTLAGASLLTLESLNGSEDMGSLASAMVQSIKVIDTYGVISDGGMSLLQSSTNDFTQRPHVPEPGTILGLLAVGGLGLVSRFKKQK
ncbi:PEP-CTERM sorting domain-containing protein [Microcystis aeruginosa]|nr:PEP-CTERM sorting domain-containing protein [Microcystis aeruginosa]